MPPRHARRSQGSGARRQRSPATWPAVSRLPVVCVQVGVQNVAPLGRVVGQQMRVDVERYPDAGMPHIGGKHLDFHARVDAQARLRMPRLVEAERLKARGFPRSLATWVRLWVRHGYGSDPERPSMTPYSGVSTR